MSDAWKGDLEINAFFSQNHSSRGDPLGALGGALVGACCVTTLIAGGFIALPAMPVIATGVVIGGAIVGGAIVGALAGEHLKKPIEELFTTPSSATQNYPGFNSSFDKIDFGKLGSGIAPTAKEIRDFLRANDHALPGKWKNWNLPGMKGGSWNLRGMKGGR